MPFVFLGYINSPTALVGVFVYLFLGHPFPTLNKTVLNWLLKTAIVGLGFSMNLEQAINAGKDGFSNVGLYSTNANFGFLGKILRMESKSSHLISSGTAICGGSAIAVVAPLFERQKKIFQFLRGNLFIKFYFTADFSRHRKMVVTNATPIRFVERNSHSRHKFGGWRCAYVWR